MRYARTKYFPLITLWVAIFQVALLGGEFWHFLTVAHTVTSEGTLSHDHGPGPVQTAFNRVFDSDACVHAQCLRERRRTYFAEVPHILKITTFELSTGACPLPPAPLVRSDLPPSRAPPFSV